MQAAILLRPLADERGFSIRARAYKAVILIGGFMFVPATMSATAAEGELCGEKPASVQALEGVIKAKPGVKVLPSAAMYVSYRDPATTYIWNFATPINPAFPSAACRRLVDIAGEHRVATNIMCEADKEACDREAEAYLQLDRQMTDAISKSGTR
jgi:hypothetical protein